MSVIAVNINNFEKYNYFYPEALNEKKKKSIKKLNGDCDQEL